MRAARAVPSFWLPFAPLLFAAIYLALRYDAIPARWVTHWGIGGVPNGWSTLSPGAVFGPLSIGLVLIAVCEGIGAVIRAQSANKPSSRELVDATIALLRYILTAAAGLIALLAAMLPFGVQNPNGIVFAGLVSIGGALALGARRVGRATRAYAAEENLRGYEGGIFYKNRDDARLWVPKIFGVGVTINFAHPWAWPVFLAMTLLPIACVIAAFAL